jgi:hypothetical protein
MSDDRRPGQEGENTSSDSMPGDKSNSRQAGAGLGIGIAIGLSLGVSIGIALDNLAIGIAIGMGFGVAIGSALSATMSKRDDAAPDNGETGNGNTERNP